MLPIRRRDLLVVVASVVVGVSVWIALTSGGNGHGRGGAPAHTRGLPAAPAAPVAPVAGSRTAPQAGGATGAAAVDRSRVGIGEQGASMFGSPLFRALRIAHARRVFPWDVMLVPGERQLADAWIGAAAAAGVEPFVSFGASRGAPRSLPSIAQFTRAFLAFRDRYPRVHVYAAWNEINHRSQPTSRNPRAAAGYYAVVRSNCPGCTVVAADVLDQPGFTNYLARFRRYAPGARLWGLHNYSDANRFRTKGTRALLAAVPGEVWLTETGGVARFGRALPLDLDRQARATAFAFALLRLDPRITRLYVYNWTAAPASQRFDAGLTNPDGSPRPAYTVLHDSLR